MGSTIEVQHAESARAPAPAHRWSIQIILYSIIVNIGPLMFGYNLVIVGAITALPKFK